MYDSAELQQAENNDSAASWSEHASQESHRDTEHMLTQESSEEKQTEHILDCKCDIFSSDQSADQQEPVVSQQTEEL